jgi:hypothetical protein
MSVEKVLRSIGDEHAVRLADAWHDHEREQRARFDGLGVEIAKAVNLSKVSTSVAGFTVAALLAGSLYVGSELGRLSESARTLQDSLKELQTGMKRLEERFTSNELLAKEIDERTKRIESKQEASLNVPIQSEPLVGSDKPYDLLPIEMTSLLTPLTYVSFIEDPVPVYKITDVKLNHLEKKIPTFDIKPEYGYIIGQVEDSGGVLINFGQGDQGWVNVKDLKPVPLVCDTIRQGSLPIPTSSSEPQALPPTIVETPFIRDFCR